MDIETRMQLALRPPTEEIVTEAELRSLFETKNKPVHYIGLEISGLLHVGSLLFNGFKINDLLEAGCECQLFLADWHSVIKRKLEGDWAKISAASKYYEEAFKFFCPGAKIVRGTDLYHANDDYWKSVLEFSQHVTLARATRCMAIMGRSENEALSTAQYFYPPMQAVDIKFIGADIAHAGMDQRKVHMLVREVFPKMGWKPPVCLHHHILPGLAEPEKQAASASGAEGKEAEVLASKMSKSKPWTAIFIHDSPDEIKSKLSKAYCPPQTGANPVLELAKYVVFRDSKTMTIERPAKFGGNAEFASYQELETAYSSGKLHAMDLKNGVAQGIAEVLKPVREHFEKKKDLLKVYGDVNVTR